jgi:hypothetical protein
MIPRDRGEGGHLIGEMKNAKILNIRRFVQENIFLRCQDGTLNRQVRKARPRLQRRPQAAP